MAVQAQHPSSVLLFNREQEMKEMDCSLPHQLMIGNATVNGNQGKRAREPSIAFQMMPTPQMNLFAPSSIQSPTTLVSLAQLQNQSSNHPLPPPLVSTGLRLAFADNGQAQPQFIQQDLSFLIDQQKDEIEQYLFAQGEQLRRTLADSMRKHYGALLAVAEESAARRLREKDVELDRAARRTAELEDRLGRLRTESLTWQAKAMSDQATAASLHAQIQQARAAAAAVTIKKPEECGESGAEDAESAHVDPNRVEGEVRTRTCRSCRMSAVSVVLLPCRHLCLCSACDADVVARCPVCHAVRTGSVQVFLS